MPFNHEHKFVSPDLINKTLLRQHLVNAHKMDAVDIAFMEEARKLGEQHQLQHTSEIFNNIKVMSGKIIHVWEEGNK